VSIRQLLKGLIDPDFIRSYRVTPTGIDNPMVTKLFQDLINISKSIDNSTMDKSGMVPRELLDSLFDIGLFSLPIPVKWNGIDANMVDFCRIITKLSEYDPALGVTVVPHSGMGIKSILYFGTEEQKCELLSHMAGEKGMITFALTESSAGSDIANVFTVLKKTGEGEYTLTGSKILITNAAWAKAIVVVAKCPDLCPIPNSLVFVLVKPDDVGLHITVPYDKMGIKASNTCEILLNDIKLSEDRIIGVPGKGIQQFNTLINSGRMGVAAGVLGLARTAYSYVRDRSRTASLDSTIRTRLFQMEAIVEVCADLFDKNIPELTLYTGITKVFCTESVYRIVNEVLDVIGLDGVLRNDEIALKLRECPISRITEGPNEIVSYRCALDLMIRFDEIVTGVNDIAPYLRRELLPCAKKFGELLEYFSGFVVTVRRNHEHFSNRQYPLDRFFRAASSLYVLLSCLMYGSSLLEAGYTEHHSPDDIAGYCDATIRWVDNELKLAALEEKELPDALTETVFKSLENIDSVGSAIF
jgi:alkylation response protein AidB-like acyl-CoA dehydrogenase